MDTARLYRGLTWSDGGAAGSASGTLFEASIDAVDRVIFIPFTGQGGAGGASPADPDPGVGGGAVSTWAALPSLICGDGVIDPEREECDDGPGNELDLCTRACQVSDSLVEEQDPEWPWESRGRILGEGRHPLSASVDGLAVTYLEPDSEPPVVGLSVFDNVATPRERIVVSEGEGSLPALYANPVSAALPDGTWAVGWSDLSADGDALGIALRKVEPDGTLGPLRTGNGSADFAQYDADLIAVGDRVVVAWSDDRDAETGPDLYYRELSLELTGGDDVALATSSALEGQVALAPLGASWGAAWRASTDDGEETIEIEDVGQQVHWTVGPIAAAAFEDHPALIELSDTLRLVVFTEGTDPLEVGFATTGRLGFAILSTDAPGSVEPQEVTFSEFYEDGPERDLSHPNVVRIDNTGILAWRTNGLPGDPNGEGVWTLPFGWRLVDGGLEVMLGIEQPIPRWPEGLVGDQRFPALAAAPLAQTTGLGAAWEDYGQQYGSLEGEPDVLVQLTPVLGVRQPGRHVDCSVQEPCDLGEGFCENDAECVTGLVCSETSGPNFGMGVDFSVCVPEHCINGVQDADEGRIDCGGTECGSCLCGDGLVFELVGEECDDTVQTATCDLDCTLPECGDGIYNPQAGEECDPSVDPSCNADCTRPPACTDGNVCLSVWRYNGGGPTDNQIQLFIRVVNNGSVSVPLDELEVRYWFTEEGTSPINVACDYAPINCNTVTRAIVPLEAALPGASHYLRLTFTGTTVLQAGQNTGDIQLRIYKQDWTNWTETDDFSYAAASSSVAAPMISMYQNGVLVWGTEPEGPSSVCGDGIVDPGEECDDGWETATCDRDCTAAACGDGVLNRTSGEVCEPSLMSGCKADCSGYEPGIPCNDPEACLHIRHRMSDAWNDNGMRPYFVLVNNGETSVPLGDLVVRYWFTAEAEEPTFNLFCDWANMLPQSGVDQCAEVVQSMHERWPEAAGAEYYWEFELDTDVVLGPGESSGEVQLRTHKADWGNFDELNDYSNTKSTTLFAVGLKVGIYREGVLVWGVEP